jgi:succinate dehydrogenase/fumarate reductase flavoprotein subunit
MEPTLNPLSELIKTHLQEWEEGCEFDLIVVGSGAAGFSAALNAVIGGAKVLLIERTEYVGGTSATSAATCWVPGTRSGLAVNPSDTAQRVKTFLDNAVGAGSDPELRQAFINAAPKAIQQLEDESALEFQVRALHPDYLSELEGSVLNGRAIEPKPFDGKLLGPNMSLVRPPIAEFTVLGGMMVDRDDIFHLLRLTKTWTSFCYSLRIITRHFWDLVFHTRSTRWVMGNALIARMLYSFIQKGGSLLTQCEVVEMVKQDVNESVNESVNGSDNESLHSKRRVTGVVVKQLLSNGDVLKRTYYARGGVVLASGGFNRHATKRAQLLPGIKPEWSPAAPGHTGTAQDLALEMGAWVGSSGVSHAFWAPVSTRRRTDGSTAAFPHFVMDRGKPGMMVVDSLGERFVNESTSYHLFGLAMQAHNAQTPCIPAWLICDAPALRRYGLGMVRPGGRGLGPFLADGYLKTGKTWTHLAQVLNLPPERLTASVERFNRFAREGQDLDFERGSTDYQRANGDAQWTGRNPCLGELLEGPFYAIALYPGDIGASTGLVTNTQAQVMSTSGQAIEGLYACGNDMQSIMGNVYPAPGITIGPGITFGYLAAQHALSRLAQSRAGHP